MTKPPAKVINTVHSPTYTTRLFLLHLLLSLVRRLRQLQTNNCLLLLLFSDTTTTLRWKTRSRSIVAEIIIAKLTRQSSHWFPYITCYPLRTVLVQRVKCVCPVVPSKVSKSSNRCEQVRRRKNLSECVVPCVTKELSSEALRTIVRGKGSA